MRRIGDLMQHDPNEEEKEALAHVLELAQGWRDGDLPISSVRVQCSGLDRYRAMRSAQLGSEDKKLLMAMVDALVNEEASHRGFTSKHGHITHQEMNQGAKQFTNWKGEQVWVWPLYWMYGEPYYPPVHIEPGDERREMEAAMNATYSAYRKAKGKLG